jgi:hypothetical protein
MAKIVTKLSLLLLSCAVFLHCANGALQPEEKQQAAPGSGTSVAASAIKVTTAANGMLGHLLQADDDEITLLTNAGWIVKLDFSGTVAVNNTNMYFGGNSCTGTPYLSSNIAIYGKSLYYDSIQYFKPASGGNIANPITSVTYSSRRIDGVCNPFSGTLNKAVELTAATVTETGLPDPITGPIVLQTP